MFWKKRVEVWAALLLVLPEARLRVWEALSLTQCVWVDLFPVDFTGGRKTSGGRLRGGAKRVVEHKERRAGDGAWAGGEGEDAANARKKRAGALGFLTGGTEDDRGNFRFINDARSMRESWIPPTNPIQCF